METHIADLIKISHYYGQKNNYVIAGGGNTSYKNTTDLWVKASGTSLADINEEGFAVLNRALLKNTYEKQYSSDPLVREAEVKQDLAAACRPGVKVRPSVETTLHDIINYAYVVHTHPTLVNAVTCSVDAEKTFNKLFGDKALFVPYTDPGYVLFSQIRDHLLNWRKKHTADPHLIILQNHGIFVGADSTDEIIKLYEEVESGISKLIPSSPPAKDLAIPENIAEILPALRMILSEDKPKIARIRNSELAMHFLSDAKHFSKVSLPFTPDQIVYCKAQPLYLEEDNPGAIIQECQKKVKDYQKRNGYLPKVIGMKNYGIMAFDDNIKSVITILDVFDDWMKISYLSENFGGPRFMTGRDIEFIDNWEVENYRRKVAGSASQTGRVQNKTVIVTGGAMGFGRGIAEEMTKEGANVIIADLNEEKGKELSGLLNKGKGKTEALFVNTNVTDPQSLQNLITQTVIYFGGFDAFISNAGILYAGSLEEMTPETFEKVTKVNYSAYFLCTKHAAPVLKLQSAYNNLYYSDIIQINSKSGLKGSNKNFAYAGGKFGGIGLTQSFALELMPFRIKVNSICPGNFFEGPLWSDPDTGLFVQYLRTGKVPGARTIADVKAHYEKQVPAGRGCRVEDVMKAVYYIIDQEYETGQAVPVTGGQEMLK